MSKKIIKNEENQLQLSLGLSSSPLPPNDDDSKKIINFSEHRAKKEKEFFFSTVDYLIKHLHE